MKSSIFYRSTSNNNYLFDFNQSILFVHPTLASLEKRNQSNCNDTKFNYEENYYLKKYHFLQKNGWFNAVTKINDISAKVKPNDIINQIANTNQLTLEVTESCNLNCKYCGYGELYNSYDKRDGGSLSFSMAKTIIDYIFDFWHSDYNRSQNNPKRISFYGGEPLLKVKLIKQIIEYVDSKKKSSDLIKYSMTTNAVLLGSHIDFLVKNDFELLISLDGNKANNSYRIDKKGKGSFQNILLNINLLKEKYPSFFQSNVNFNSVLHNRNSLEDILVFFDEKFKKKPLIGELNTSGLNSKTKSEFDKLYTQKEKSIFSSTKQGQIVNDIFVEIPTIKDLAQFIFQYTEYAKLSPRNLFIDKHKLKYTPTGTCLPFSRKIFVTVNGKILPCETIGAQFKLGIIKDNFVQIDHSSIADYYNHKYKKIKKQCSKCYMQRTCIQCIFNMEFVDGQPKCSSIMNRKSFAKYLSKNTNIVETNSHFYSRIIEKTTLN